MQTKTRYVLLNTLLSLAMLMGLVGASWAAPVPAVTPSPKASYIIQGLDPAQLTALVEQYGGKVTSRLDIIHAVAATLPAGAAARIAAEAGVVQVSPNSAVEISGDATAIPSTDYPDETGATVAWQNGVTGAGVGVAVVDTGITLMDGLVRNPDGKSTKLVAWKDFVNNSKLPIDPNGHGTHVAGIIANSQKGADKEYNGMAPAANLIAVRVLNEKGAGTYEDIINGIQWVITNRKAYNIRVMNLSLNGVASSPYWADPLDQAVTKAWSVGITLVVAAGNKGPGAMTIGVPGNNPYAITVGAFTDHYSVSDWSDDYIADFSSTGPTLDAFVKPDVVAPGAHIVSTMPILSYDSLTHSANWVSSRYFSMAGTSQSAAVVSGIAALAVSGHPNLTPNQVKYRILTTALPWVSSETHQALYSVWQQGAGRVNAADAVLANIQGEANRNMDITADLKGKAHYEGFSTYDAATGKFSLLAPFDSLNNSYVAWDGSYGAWSDSYGAWSDSYGAWSDSYGAWSDSYGAWSDSYGAWSDSYGAWSDGYTAWAGGTTAWSGSEPWAGSIFSTSAFITAYKAGKAPATTSPITTDLWVGEP